MNTRVKHLAVVAALCGFVSVMPVCRASAMDRGDYPMTTRLVRIDPRGPKAGLYLGQDHGTTSAQYAKQNGRNFSPTTENSPRASIYPPGPEADPYLQHYHGTSSARYAEQYWRELLLADGNSPQASIYPPGPEADPYLQHYQGTLSSRYGTPEKLMASNQSSSTP